ncbi:MAG TPA: tannase/feruloyl esterase family alpha/beta hydrolase, partial [Burkholderiaceae bacterium]|nr:tannase/feruloyl esterase family alpha/beta hydrolase [Burkholderiaceae bacterium]
DMSLLTSEVVAAKAEAPEHCHLVARFGERAGANGQTYATRMRLRLPADASWNGRFYFEGGGGTDGNLGAATGATMAGERSALARGFAVVSTDAGHDNAVNNDPDRGGSATFGLDPQARLDYGYNALDAVTRQAKGLLETFYDRPPEYSYFVGCSNGGRQAMMASQRFPEHFDGIVAGNPGFNLPRAGIAEAWDSQQFASAARAIDASQVDPQGHPLIRFGFSPSDLQLVADDILAVCDKLDGVEDGIVGDFAPCNYDPAVRLPALQCLITKQPGCLAVSQVQALQRVMAGPRNSANEPLYSDWPWDPGIAAGGWRAWKLETAPNAPVNNAINLTLGAAALPYVFTTPPTITTDLVGYMLNFDMDNDAPKIEATSGEFSTPAMQFMAANSTDLSAFRARGAKMIVYHGLADPVFSFNDTRNWYGGVVAASGGSNAGLANARSFVRLFPVPGMNHCSGGPATDRFDALTAVVDWVEQGVAPDSILASANPASGFAGRTRPLCPYPQVARYDGSSDIEQAASFVCR